MCSFRVFGTTHFRGLGRVQTGPTAAKLLVSPQRILIPSVHF